MVIIWQYITLKHRFVVHGPIWSGYHPLHRRIANHVSSAAWKFDQHHHSVQNMPVSSQRLTSRLSGVNMSWIIRWLNTHHHHTPLNNNLISTATRPFSGHVNNKWRRLSSFRLLRLKVDNHIKGREPALAQWFVYIHVGDVSLFDRRANDRFPFSLSDLVLLQMCFQKWSHSNKFR